MAVLRSSLDTAGETYRANRQAQLALLDQLNEQIGLAIAGGGPRYQRRHRDRGRLLARGWATPARSCARWRTCSAPAWSAA